MRVLREIIIKKIIILYEELYPRNGAVWHRTSADVKIILLAHTVLPYGVKSSRKIINDIIIV